MQNRPDKKRIILIAVIAVGALALIAGGLFAAVRFGGLSLPGLLGPSPSPTPTEEPSPTPTATVIPAPSVTSTPVPLDQLFDITVHPPSCTASGYSVYVSKESGGINIRDEVPRLPHEYTVEKVDAATGETYFVCSMCGRRQPEDSPGR